MRASTMAMYAGLIYAAAIQCTPLTAQGNLPATAPTSVSDLPSARPGAALAATPGGSGHVIWSGSAITIDGGGDSLRNILLQIKQQTGMKVTGGIPDERVFGKYGPGPVQQVLGEIFDGLPINLLLLNDSPTRPKELILTARTGGVTPPMASPIRNDESVVRANALQGQSPNSNGFNPGPPPPTSPQPGTPPPSDQGSPAPAPSADTNSSSPDANGSNGSKTPEQIFEELRRRQQQGSGTAQ